jgi:hypothetical protein
VSETDSQNALGEAVGSLEIQLRAHAAIERAYESFNAFKRPLAAMEPTKLLSPKPHHERKDWVWGHLIQRDIPILALVSKAATTKAAIVHLATHDFGVDAWILCRALYETVVVVSWLLHSDKAKRERRIDTYVLHENAFNVRADSVAPLPGDARANQRSREISAEAFEDRWLTWAWMSVPGKAKKQQVKLREMAEEHPSLLAMYDRDYLHMSAHLHSAPGSVLLTADRQFKLLELKPEIFRGKSAAIAWSNLSMWYLLDVVAMAYRLPMQRELVDAVSLLCGVEQEHSANGKPEQ